MKGLKKCNARQNDCSSVMVDVDEPFKMIDRSRFIFEDGSCFNILSEGNLYNRSTLSGIFDYNCNKKPNNGGKDQFYFYIVLASNANDVTPFTYSNKYDIRKHSRLEILEHCKANKFSCGALIQFDNWNIGDDYPIKF